MASPGLSWCAKELTRWSSEPSTSSPAAARAPTNWVRYWRTRSPWGSRAAAWSMGLNMVQILEGDAGRAGGSAVGGDVGRLRDGRAGIVEVDGREDPADA